MQIQSNNHTSFDKQSIQSLTSRPTKFNLSENNINAMDMGMDVDSGNQISAFFLLSSTLYKEPYRAIIRELVSNAIDASKQLPIEEQKDVILHIPSNISNQEFYVQDFGIGMSLEQVINIYGNYFASNKQNDANSIGGFGLGGKTPFIYVKNKPDGFKLETTSPEDGVRRTFVFKMLQNEHGSLKPIYYYLDNLDEVDSQIKGTKVSFKLDDEKDIALFTESIGDILFSMYPIQFKGIFELDDVFNNVLQKIEMRTKNLFLTHYHYIKEKIANKELIKFNDDFSYIDYPIPNKNSCSKIHLLLGNIYYQYSLDKQGGIKALLTKLHRMNNDISSLNPDYTVFTQFPFIQSNCNGKITFSLSREHIQKNEDNDQIMQDLVVEHLQNQVVKVNKLLINEINKKFSEIKNIFSNIKKLEDKKIKDYNHLWLKYDFYHRIDLLKTINSKYSHSLLSKDDLSYLDNMFKELHEIFSDLRSCYYKEKLNIGCSLLFIFEHPKQYKVHFFILDDVEKKCKQGSMHFCKLIKNFKTNDNYKIHYELVISTKQYNILKEYNYPFEYEPVFLNEVAQEFLDKIEEEKKQLEIKRLEEEKALQEKQDLLQKQKLLKRQEQKIQQLNDKPKLVENESNGFYLIQFEEMFSKNITKKTDNSISVSKHSEKMIQLEPIALPKTIKLDITTINNPILEKNVQFLIDMEMLRFNKNKVLINQAFLKDTNNFFQNLSFKTKNNLLKSVDVFKPISNIIQFQFVDDDKFNHLHELDFLQYILNSINERLVQLYQKLDDDFHYYMRDGFKDILNNKWQVCHNLFSPFTNISEAYYSVIIDDILHKKINKHMDNLIDKYFKKVNTINKRHILIRSLGIFDDLRYHHQKFNLPFVNWYNYEPDFFYETAGCVYDQIESVYERKDVDKQGLKYSKDFYQEHIKPILEQY